MKSEKNVFIFHGTEGHPEENWFPWLSKDLSNRGFNVIVPQFPSPPVVPSSVSEWFDVFENYSQFVDSNTTFIGHSLGGLFALRFLESLNHKISSAFFVGTPIGVEPISEFQRVRSFSGFDFNWDVIKESSDNFVVYQSDNDPYVCEENGRDLAKNLDVELSYISGAGHFNEKAGYLQFTDLRDRFLEIEGSK